MIVFRLEDPDGHGPAYGRPDNPRAREYWARVGHDGAYARLHQAIVYQPPTPEADHALGGVRRHEKFGVSPEQLRRAAATVDGLSFLLDCLHAYRVPAEDVRVGSLQVVFVPPGAADPKD